MFKFAAVTLLAGSLILGAGSASAQGWNGYNQGRGHHSERHVGNVQGNGYNGYAAPYANPYQQPYRYQSYQVPSGSQGYIGNQYYNNGSQYSNGSWQSGGGNYGQRRHHGQRGHGWNR